MSKIYQIRQSLQHQLEQWGAMAESFELQLTLGRAEALQRFDEQRQRLRAQVQELKSRLAQIDELGEDARTRAQAALEHLEVQLALARAETRDAYLEQRDKLRQAIHALEERLDGAAASGGEGLRQRIEAELQTFAGHADRLLAELEALEFQFQVHAESARQRLADAKNALLLKIDAFRKQLGEQQGQLKERMQQSQEELGQAARHLKEAFARLLGHQ
jgi:gas vesicle protein